MLGFKRNFHHQEQAILKSVVHYTGCDSHEPRFGIKSWLHDSQPCDPGYILREARNRNFCVKYPKP